MINLFKRPKVKFLCSIEAALIAYPVEPINKAVPKWLETEAAEYSKDYKEINANTLSKTTFTKCKGIRELYKTGWVVRAWQDIYVDANDDGSFEWRTKVNQSAYNGVNEVSAHSPDTFKHCPHLSKYVPILKIQTPWVMDIPKGYSALQLPVAYQDNPLFTGVEGIYNRNFGLMDLTIQLFWHGRGPQMIKAGTPLAHFILIKNEKIECEVRVMNEEEVKVSRLQRMLKNICFKPNYKDMLTAIKKTLKD
jgi:hypothetical protein